MSIEIYIRFGTITDNKEKGIGKWSPIYNELKDLWNMNCIYNIYCIFFKQFIYLYNLSCLWCNKMIKSSSGSMPWRVCLRTCLLSLEI